MIELWYFALQSLDFCLVVFLRIFENLLFLKFKGLKHFLFQFAFGKILSFQKFILIRLYLLLRYSIVKHIIKSWGNLMGIIF